MFILSTNSSTFPVRGLQSALLISVDRAKRESRESSRRRQTWGAGDIDWHSGEFLVEIECSDTIVSPGLAGGRKFYYYDLLHNFVMYCTISSCSLVKMFWQLLNVNKHDEIITKMFSNVNKHDEIVTKMPKHFCM